MIRRILWNISCETCVIKYVHFQEKALSYKRKKFNKIDLILYFRFINYESLKQNVSEILIDYLFIASEINKISIFNP